MDDLTKAPRGMTHQEIFDAVVERIRAQGTHAYDEHEGNCAYETPDGRRCAVGVLLKREHLNALHVGEDADAMFASPDNLPGKIQDWLGVDGRAQFWSAVQTAHDWAAESVDPWDVAWPRAMRGVADHYSLDASALNEAGSGVT